MSLHRHTSARPGQYGVQAIPCSWSDVRGDNRLRLPLSASFGRDSRNLEALLAGFVCWVSGPRVE